MYAAYQIYQIIYQTALFVIIFYTHQQDAVILVPPTEPPTTPSSDIPKLPTIDEIFTDGKHHPCYRDCNGPPMTCYYHFKVEWYQSMSKACYDCPFNITDCGRKDCIPGNGVSRTLTVINRKMPGPSVEVCHNDKIIVDVENDLMAAGTTVHWHGMHQRETPFMDGVPFVTQCPIQPDSTFRYKFTAAQPGTYFWHSHIGLQRADGDSGALVIRQPKMKDPHGQLYDFDISEHVLLFNDRIDQLALSMFTKYYHSVGNTNPTALLINGLGKFNVINGNRTAMLNPARFEVQKGYRYRFRLINANFLNCPVEVSVDGHNITVIASDGFDLEPVTAKSIVLFSGERYDVILHTYGKVSNYWIKVRGLLGCATEAGVQVGVLHYKGAIDAEPSGTVTWPDLSSEGLQINSINKAEEQNITMPVSELRSLQGHDDSLKPVPDYKFYIYYDLYAVDNSHFFKFPYYGINQVRNVFRISTPQLNHISMQMPNSPLLVSRPSIDSFCNESSVRNSCKVDYCACPHVLNVKLNSTVELIIIDEGASFDTSHPLHLHGISFRVVGQRRLASSTTVDKVKAYDSSGQMTRNLRNPPLKDTVSIPDGGYTIVRFKADNPGYWLFHCHIEFHTELGMALVFKVGEHEDMKPVPQDFPTCGDYGNGGFKSKVAILEN